MKCGQEVALGSQRLPESPCRLPNSSSTLQMSSTSEIPSLLPVPVMEHSHNPPPPPPLVHEPYACVDMTISHSRDQIYLSLRLRLERCCWSDGSHHRWIAVATWMYICRLDFPPAPWREALTSKSVLNYKIQRFSSDAEGQVYPTTICLFRFPRFSLNTPSVPSVPLRVQARKVADETWD